MSMETLLVSSKTHSKNLTLKTGSSGRMDKTTTKLRHRRKRYAVFFFAADSTSVMRSENNDDIVKHEPEFSKLWKSPREMTSNSSMCSLGTLGTHHQYQSLRGKAVGEPDARNLEVLWHPLHLGLLGNIGNTSASQKKCVQLYSPKPPEITVHRRGEIIRLRGRRLLHTRWLYFLKAKFETVFRTPSC